MADFIAIVILVGIVAAAAYYVYRAKKSGKKCIGCPNNRPRRLGKIPPILSDLPNPPNVP